MIRECHIGRDVTLIAGKGALLDVAADLVGPRSTIVARTAIRIGTGTKIAENVTVRDADHDHSFPLKDGVFKVSAVTVGDDVWLAAGSTVLSGVSIGDGATIGAGAVVTKTIPGGTTAVGIPARPITLR